MIIPIYAYGHPVLKKVCEDIPEDYPQLKELIANMFETMYNSSGIGLAAPQIGKAIRLFIIDTTQTEDEDTKEEDRTGIVKVFINAQKIEESGKPWYYEEGCLSIPDIRGDVKRPAQVRLQYYDANFKFHDEVFTGMNARVIQHEYDHIDGILFTEYLSGLRRRLIKRKLESIKKGKIESDYPMRFMSVKGRR